MGTKGQRPAVFAALHVGANQGDFGVGGMKNECGFVKSQQGFIDLQP